MRCPRRGVCNFHHIFVPHDAHPRPPAHARTSTAAVLAFLVHHGRKMLGTMRRRAETHHTPSDETLPCGDGSNFLGLGGGANWTGFMLPQHQHQHQHQPMPFQRGFLNCFFWCGGPSGNVVDEDEELGDEEEDLAVGLPDVSVFLVVLLCYRNVLRQRDRRAADRHGRGAGIWYLWFVREKN